MSNSLLSARNILPPAYQGLTLTIPNTLPTHPKQSSRKLMSWVPYFSLFPARLYTHFSDSSTSFNTCPSLLHTHSHNQSVIGDCRPWLLLLLLGWVCLQLVQEPSSGSPPPSSSHSLLSAARAVSLKHKSHHDCPSRPTGCRLNGLSIIPAPPAGLPAAPPLRLHSRHQTLLIFTPLCICSCSSLHRTTFCLQSCFLLLNMQLNAPTLCAPFLIPLLQIPQHISLDLLIAAPFA